MQTISANGFVIGGIFQSRRNAVGGGSLLGANVTKSQETPVETARIRIHATMLNMRFVRRDARFKLLLAAMNEFSPKFNLISVPFINPF